MAMRLTLLGTGNVAQVPVYNCDCAACIRARRDARHRRGPCSALLETESGRWLIDAGLTDLAERFPPGSLSGIVLTHYHADHAQGLLHLRWGTGMRLPVIGPPDPEGLADLYKHPGILDFSHTLKPFSRLDLNGVRVTALPLSHSMVTYGYLFEGAGAAIAYLTDTVGLPEATRDFLKPRRLDILVLDCSHPPSPTPPRNHNDLNLARSIVGDLAPERAVLTHIGHDLDEYLMGNPAALEIGYDGQVLVPGS